MTATTAAQCAPATSPDEAYQQALQLTLRLAVGHHESDQLREAEQLYRGILKAEPGQRQASHNLGLLLLQLHQPAAALPHLEAALAAKPESERYWLSYIDALRKDGQFALARERLAFAREYGLEAGAAEAPAAMSHAGPPLAQPVAERQPGT